MQGLIDDVPPAARVKVVCARCEYIYEVAGVEKQERGIMLFGQTPEPDLPVASADDEPLFDDVLTIPQDPLDLYDESEQSVVLEAANVAPQADFRVQTFEQAEPSAPVALVPEPVHSPVATPHEELAEENLYEEPEPLFLSAPAAVVETVEDEEGVLELSETPAPQVPPVQPVQTTVANDYDGYAVGARLMRVTPLWLLVSGIGFTALLLLCSWMARPIGQPGEVSAQGLTAQATAALNQATNTSVAPPPVARTSVAKTAPEAAKPAASDVKTTVEAQKPEAQQPAPPAEEKKAPEKPQPAPQPASVATEANGKITVQVGSYSDTAQAEGRAASLRSAGFDARVVSVEIPKRGTWYRVQSGRFGTRDAATRYGAELRARGVADSAIVTEVQ